MNLKVMKFICKKKVLSHILLKTFGGFEKN